MHASLLAHDGQAAMPGTEAMLTSNHEQTFERNQVANVHYGTRSPAAFWNGRSQHTHTHTQTHTNTHTHIHTHTYQNTTLTTHIHSYKHARMHTHMHMHTFIQHAHKYNPHTHKHATYNTYMHTHATHNTHTHATRNVCREMFFGDGNNDFFPLVPRAHTQNVSIYM